VTALPHQMSYLPADHFQEMHTRTFGTFAAWHPVTRPSPKKQHHTQIRGTSWLGGPCSFAPSFVVK